MSSRTRRFLIAVLGVALPLASGCNAILGVDNHSLKSGTGGTGGTAGTAGTAGNMTCSFDASVMQADSADAGTSSCAFIMPNPAYPASYAPPSDNSVLDNVTKLTWESTVDPSSNSQDQAARYCALKGSPWRLPTRLELASLLDVSIANPNPTSLPVASTLHPMIAGIFQNTPAARFWTSSHKADTLTTGWYVGFDFGNSKQVDVSSPYKVRCVHGTPSCPVKRYEIRDADATVRDFATGLRWQRSYSQDQMAWSDAIAFCPNTFGSDWRLPSVTELLTIVDETREQPSIDPNVFPCVSTMMSLEWFWTSSPYAGDPTWAYYVTFIHGHEDIEPVTTHYYVRCVSWEGP